MTVSASAHHAAPSSGLLPRVLAVVVLYNTAFSQSKTLLGLAAAFQERPSLAAQLDVLVWDNSPLSPSDTSLPFAATYHHAAVNSGVAGAYNFAATRAQQQGVAWLLLLDDDTSVTAEFLTGMLRHAATVDPQPDVAAVVPHLYDGRVPLSPQLWRFARHQPLPRAAAPYTERRSLFAANSGTLMRVAALAAIGGYSPRFWLDHSDIYVFSRLHAQGFRVRIASDLVLQHEMAMLDYDGRMTPARYANFLAAEGGFTDMARGPLERAAYLLRLAVRVARQRRYADAAFSKMTRGALLRRLRTGRRARLAAWNATDRSDDAHRD